VARESDFDYDAMGDDELLERCARSRAAMRELELTRGVAMMGAAWWPPESKLAAFMAIFHPTVEVE
jgi:hypothetical protein